MITIKEINELGVMSSIEDLILEEAILEIHAPKNILEMGLGGGGWSVFANARTRAKIIGIENFDYAKYKIGYGYGHDWIDNINELQNKLQTNDITIKTDVTQIPRDIIFDLVRLDCLDQEKDIEEFWNYILPQTSDAALFFVDDVIPCIAVFRLVVMMKLCERKILKPVWMGNKEGVWCKYSYDCSWIQQHLVENNFRVQESCLSIADEPQKFLIYVP